MPEFLQRATTLRAARISPVGAAVVVSERVGSEVLLPDDRNLAAGGRHARRARPRAADVVCRTGSPRVAGDYPSAGGGSPWDVDSVGLVTNRDSPVRQESVQHLANIRSYLCGLAAQAGVEDPDSFARQWHILMKGSIIAAAVGDTHAAARARELGILLLDQHGIATS